MKASRWRCRPVKNRNLEAPLLNQVRLSETRQVGGTKKAMDENREKVKLLASDLRDSKEFPRSPRQTLADYVLAARAVDNCRAVLRGWEGECHCKFPLDQRWLKFAE